MGGLREKRKAETAEKILSVSREIFFSKGYAGTTIEEIAEQSGIAVGTVYNFYKTKADILVAVVAKEADMENWNFTLKASDLEQGVVDIVMDFTWKSFGKLKFLTKKMWKELMVALFGSLKAESRLMQGLFSLDLRYLEKFRMLLGDLKAQGALMPDFDVDSAAMVIYGIFLTQFLLYIYSDDATFDQMEQNIRGQVVFALEGKCLNHGQGVS